MCRKPKQMSKQTQSLWVECAARRWSALFLWPWPSSTACCHGKTTIIDWLRKINCCERKFKCAQRPAPLMRQCNEKKKSTMRVCISMQHSAVAGKAKINRNAKNIIKLLLTETNHLCVRAWPTEHSDTPRTMCNCWIHKYYDLWSGAVTWSDWMSRPWLNVMRARAEGAADWITKWS